MWPFTFSSGLKLVECQTCKYRHQVNGIRALIYRVQLFSTSHSYYQCQITVNKCVNQTVLQTSGKCVCAFIPGRPGWWHSQVWWVALWVIVNKDGGHELPGRRPLLSQLSPHTEQLIHPPPLCQEPTYFSPHIGNQ